jgi:hypothetical protein
MTVKDYKEYIDNISADEKLHKKIKASQDLAANSTVIRFNPMIVLAASLLLIIGISTAVIFSLSDADPFAENGNSHGEEDYLSFGAFLTLLEASGLNIDETIQSTYDAFEVSPMWIYIGQEEIQFFEFENSAAALRNFGYIDGFSVTRPTGNGDELQVVHSQYSGTETFHWFVVNNAMIQYNGTNVDILRVFRNNYSRYMNDCHCAGCLAVISTEPGTAFEAFLSFLDGKAGQGFDYEIIFGGGASHRSAIDNAIRNDVRFTEISLDGVIQFYEFATEEEAWGFTAFVSPESVQTDQYAWRNAASPHWFIFDNAIMYYPGEDVEILRFLRFFFDIFAGCLDVSEWCDGCVNADIANYIQTHDNPQYNQQNNVIINPPADFPENATYVFDILGEGDNWDVQAHVAGSSVTNPANAINPELIKGVRYTFYLSNFEEEKHAELNNWVMCDGCISVAWNSSQTSWGQFQFCYELSNSFTVDLSDYSLEWLQVSAASWFEGFEGVVAIELLGENGAVLQRGQQ